MSDGTDADEPDAPDVGSEPGRGDDLEDADIHGTADATLAGYIREHDRPPAFEGSDGQPYTVSIEVEKVGDLNAPYVGYLVFPRWAETGLGVIGHVETPLLLRGRDSEEIGKQLGDLSLHRIKHLLDEAIERREEEERAP